MADADGNNILGGGNVVGASPSGLLPDPTSGDKKAGGRQFALARVESLYEDQMKENAHSSSILNKDRAERTLRDRLWVFLESPQSSKLAQSFSWVIMFLIFVSVVATILETEPTLNDEPWETDFWFYLELVCIIVFTLEVAARYYASPTYRAYFCNFMNMVDLVAIVPFFIERFIPEGQAGGGTKLVRIVRLVRVARIFKVSRYSHSLMLFVFVIKRSAGQLAVLYAVVLVLVVVAAAVMHTAEGFREATTAEFDGDHGWVWRNRDNSDVTVRVQVRGDYQVFKDAS